MSSHLQKTMSLTSFIGGFFVAATTYCILAGQLWMGFPPLYRKFGSESADEIEELAPGLFFAMVGMIAFVATELLVFLAVMGFSFAWCGFRFRSLLDRYTKGPRGWLNISVAQKWPMLLFDCWTLGFSALFVLLPVLAD